jgi:four helix bundle protein
MGGFSCVEDCKAWQLSRELVREIYRATSSGTFNRDFGLRDQVRRAAVSVASNIAEGFERGGNREFIQYLYQAKGSCGEVRTQLYLAWDLDYLTEDSFNRLREMTVKISEVIWGLIRYLKQSSITGIKYKK